MKAVAYILARVLALGSGLFLGTSLCGQTLRELGTLGGAQSFGLGLNNAGQVTGVSQTPGNAALHAFLHTNGTMMDLGTLGGTQSRGEDVNNLGQVTGSSQLAGNSAQHAFLFAGGVMTDLGTLGGTQSVGLRINDLGEVTGSSFVGGNTAEHVFLYSDGEMTDLGTLGGSFGSGEAINNLGQVTGRSMIAGDAAMHAFLYSDGKMTDLGTLGGATSVGHGVNDLGQVAGFSQTASGSFHAFLYSDGVMTDLGTLDGGSSRAFDINELGQVVGFSDGRAFLYSDGTMSDLNVLHAALLSDGTIPGFMQLNEARGINDVGQITGYGIFFDGTTNRNRAFLLDTRPSDTVPPTAEAGPDQAIRAGAAVTLDGSASFDDNTPTESLSFAWQFAAVPAGSSATLSGADNAAPSFVADVVGTFVVSLVVTDQAGLASEPSLVTISTENLAPNAVGTVTPNLAVIGNTVLLDGSASSDPENDPIEFIWSIVSSTGGYGGTINPGAAGLATFVPHGAGTYTLRLTVSDPYGPGTPILVPVVATNAESFTEIVVVETAAIVAELPVTMVTTEGNQQAFTSFLGQVLAATEAGDTEEAISKLKKAMERTDGWVLRGAADENGPGRDWITDRDAQLETYAKLKAALDALVGG